MMLTDFGKGAFSLPNFDDDRPYSILDRAFDDQDPSRTSGKSKGDEVSSCRDLVQRTDEVNGEDSVLHRVLTGTKDAIGVLPEADKDLRQTWNILDGLRSPKADLPLSWIALEEARIPSLVDISKQRDAFEFQHPTFSPADEDYLIGRIQQTGLDQLSSGSNTNSEDVLQPTILQNERAEKYLETDLWLPAEGIAGDDVRWNDANFSFEAVLGTTACRRTYKRFLRIGTMQRRIRWCIQQIDEGRLNSRREVIPELFALSGGLSEILSWTSSLLQSLCREKHSLLRSSAELADLEDLLQDVSELLLCDSSQGPPFTAFKAWLQGTSTHSSGISKYSSKRHSAHILSLLHAHLIACAETNKSSMLTGSLRYLIDITSQGWLQQVSNWIGWPCREGQQLRHELEDKIAISFDQQSMKRGGHEGLPTKNSYRFEPWAGIEVEWSWDERQELDVGYTLRPARLPSFLPVAQARDLLEGGRALRLLQRAAPAGHPLVALNEHQGGLAESTANRRFLAIPRWTYRVEDIESFAVNVERIIADMQREIAAWRKYHDAGSALAKVPTHPRSEEKHWKDQRAEDDKPLTMDLEAALALYEQAPDANRSDDTKSNDAPIETKRDLASHMDLLCRDEQQAYPAKAASQCITESSLRPLLQWSHLVNASLISVFFRDLYLGEYLDVCYSFMLLGSPLFLSNLVEVLFDDNGEQGGADDTQQKASGVGLSKTLRMAEAWPPIGSTLNNALNGVIYDGIEYHQRSIAAMDKGKVGLPSISKVQLLDLDSRLSFAIVKPEAIAGDCSRESTYALDWLSISFQPPPLIAPLITLQAQTYYQRIFRFLLRLLRIEATLKLVRRRLFDKRSSYAGMPAWMDGWDIERAERLRYEAQHFITVILRHTTDVVIKQRWQVFRKRLHALRESSEAKDAQAEGGGKEPVTGPSERGESDLPSYYETGSEIGSELIGEDDDVNTVVYDAGEMEHGQGGRSEFEVKDVFSIAAFHERTLDRMLAGCFLKAKQRTIMTIMMDMCDLILRFSRLIEAKSDEEDAANAYENSNLLETLLAGFQSKSRLLLHALELVSQQAMKDGAKAKGSEPKMQMASEQPKSSSSSQRPHRTREPSAASVARLAAVTAEIERQEMETRRDLEQLERSDRKESVADLEILQALIAALRGG